MKSATKKKIGIGLTLLVVLVAGAFGLFLLKRQQLLRYAMQQVKTRGRAQVPRHAGFRPSPVHRPELGAD